MTAARLIGILPPATQLIMAAALGLVSVHPVAARADDGPRKVWIYTDFQPRTDGDPECHQENTFAPFFFFPEQATDGRIFVDVQATGDEPGKTGTDTCLEFSLKFKGAGDFLGAKFIPGGKDPGTQPGANVNQLLRLGRDAQKRVVLKFMARCPEGASPRVDFTLGGVGGKHKDGIKFSKVLSATLSSTWTEYTINLTGNPKALESVVCPFGVAAKSNENTGVDAVTVYVDDIRFEIVEPTVGGTEKVASPR